MTAKTLIYIVVTLTFSLVILKQLKGDLLELCYLWLVRYNGVDDREKDPPIAAKHGIHIYAALVIGYLFFLFAI